jgi:hypothetical protein
MPEVQSVLRGSPSSRPRGASLHARPHGLAGFDRGEARGDSGVRHLPYGFPRLCRQPDRRIRKLKSRPGVSCAGSTARWSAWPRRPPISAASSSTTVFRRIAWRWWVAGWTRSAFRPQHRDPALRAQWGAGIRHWLLYVGRLSREKNLPCLAEAFRQLSARRPDVGLVVVGEGPYRAEFEQATPGPARGLRRFAARRGAGPPLRLRRFICVPQPHRHVGRGAAGSAGLGAARAGVGRWRAQGLHPAPPHRLHRGAHEPDPAGPPGGSRAGRRGGAAVHGPRSPRVGRPAVAGPFVPRLLEPASNRTWPRPTEATTEGVLA